MGVIRRFVLSSIVLGTLAMLGGASALAFDGGTDAATEGTGAGSTGAAFTPQFTAAEPTVSAAVRDARMGWMAPHGVDIGN